MLTKSQKKWNEKLIKALRSGKYKQAESRLREDNSYCCLGVACDISKLGKWEEEPGGHTFKTLDGLESDSHTATNSVMDLFGFSSCNGHKPGYLGNPFADMVDLNDRYKQSFKQIALRLERWLAKQEIVKEAKCQ